MLRNIPVTVIVVMALAGLVFAGQAVRTDTNTENTAQIIDYLIGRVAGSPLTFIRNGKEYSSEQAAAHIRKKYDYFKSRIETPEDFIRLCASRSLVSGKPYEVVAPDGVVTLQSWLYHILAMYREKRGRPSH